MRKKLLTTLVLLIGIQLLLISTVNAQPVVPIGQTIQPNPFDSNPGGSARSKITVTDSTNSYDGSLSTLASFVYGSATGYFEVKRFTTAKPTFTIGWVDIKVSYKAAGAWYSDERYRILCYVGSASPIVLQDWVSGDAAAYDPGTNEQGHRVWSNVDEPNDHVWDWGDIGGVVIRIETEQVTSDNNMLFSLYEVWLTAYKGNPLPPAGMSVQPSVVENFGPSGEIFFVEVYFSGVELLWGYQFILRFDPAVLICLEYFSYGPFNSPGPGEIKPDYVSIAYSSYFGDSEGLTGMGPATRIYFRLRVSTGSSALDIDEETVVLSDVYGDAILVDVYDGMFSTGALPEFPLGLSAIIMLAPIIPLVYIWRLRKKVVKR